MYLSTQKSYWLDKIIPHHDLLLEEVKELPSLRLFFAELSDFSSKIMGICKQGNEAIAKYETHETFLGFSQRMVAQITKRFIQNTPSSSSNSSFFNAAAQEVRTFYLEKIGAEINDFRATFSSNFEFLSDCIRYRQAYNCESLQQISTIKEGLATEFILGVFPEFAALEVEDFTELVAYSFSFYNPEFRAYFDLKIELELLRRQRSDELKIRECEKKLRLFILSFRKKLLEDTAKDSQETAIYRCLYSCIQTTYADLSVKYPQMTFNINDNALQSLARSYLTNPSNHDQSLISYVQKEWLFTAILGNLNSNANHYFSSFNLKNDKAKAEFLGTLFNFNDVQARLAASMLTSEGEIDPTFCQDYTEALEKQLIATFLGDSLPPEKQSFSEVISNSVSSLLKNESLQRAFSQLDKLANAHAFIQHTGWSTQNESSHLAILDFYNYLRSTEKINELRSILMQLVKPVLSPLYYEYRDIAHSEQLLVWKLVRFLIPIIIVVSFLVLITVALASLALPELLIGIVMIPTFLLGVSLASFYVKFKNELHHNIELLIALGDPYKTSPYRVNNRLTYLFNGRTNAKAIQQFYIDLFKKCDDYEIKYKKQLIECDRLESLYQHDDTKKEQRAMNINKRNALLELRNTNRDKKNALLFEWCDLTINHELNDKDALTIAYRRVNSECRRSYGVVSRDMSKIASELAAQMENKIFDRKDVSKNKHSSKFFQAVEKDLSNHQKNIHLTEIFTSKLDNTYFAVS